MRWKFALFLVSFCVSLLLAAVSAQTHWFFYQNIIHNPGAEDGAASPDGMSAVPIPEWTAMGGATVVAYGTPGDFPSVADPIPRAPGSNFFVGGPGASSSTIFQAIDVPPELWPFIDSSLGVSYMLNGWLGGFASDGDYASVAMQLKNASGDVIESNGLGPVTALDRNDATALLPRNVWGFVPWGTRRIEVAVTFTRVDGPYNNACADNIELWFHPLDAAPPVSWGGIKDEFRMR